MGGDGWMSVQKTKQNLTAAQNACRHGGNFFVKEYVHVGVSCESFDFVLFVYFCVKAWLTLTPPLVLTATFFAQLQEELWKVCCEVAYFCCQEA